MMYHPYAGGRHFPKMETLTIKPGFKVWVDGGRIDYSQEICYAKMLDCSETCCMSSYCAPTLGDCLIYKRRPYDEVYIGSAIAVAIVAGVPTCILAVEFLLNYKFCTTFNEDIGSWMGGMTICESFTYCFTCGESYKNPVRM